MLTALSLALVLAAVTTATAAPPLLVQLLAIASPALGAATFQLIKRLNPAVDALPKQWKVIAAPVVTIAWLAIRYLVPDANLPADFDALTVEAWTAALAILLTWVCHALYKAWKAWRGRR